MAITIITANNNLKNQDNKPYLFPDYFNDYKKVDCVHVPRDEYKKIIKAFFYIIKQYLLNGGLVNLPIGKFKIKEKSFDPTKLHISFAYTKKLRQETGNNKIIGYRDLSIPYFEPKAILKSFLYINEFKFKAYKQFTSIIPEYFVK